jgi:cytochrome c oxidase subunit IV
MADPHAPSTGATDHKHDYAKEADSAGGLFAVYAVVLGLALANVGLSGTGLGKYALVLQLGIGTVQAALVSYYFMHLRQGDKVVILTALASIFWTGILFVLFLSDYMTRGMVVGW